MEDMKVALLIDGDNISASYITSILDELTEIGVTTIKRIYGDWTRPEMRSWRQELLNRSIQPVQQFANVSGKNATDSALIIDAMDILYLKDVDCFCIVSSDSDFTRLASRLAESGKMVIGMGEEKTPGSFRNACTRFVSLENLKTSEGDLAQADKPSLTGIEHTIAKAIRDNENRGRQTSLAEVGSRLSKKYPDFDVRSYGYSYLSRFIEDMPRFELSRANNTVTVSISEHTAEASKKQVERFIQECVIQHDGHYTINQLSNKVYQHFPTFKLKDLGYSQFHKLVASVKGVKVKQEGNEKYAVAEK